VSSLFTGTHNADWQAYWDNGAASNYLVEYDGSSTFRFTVGRAFWIISKGALNISRTVTAQSLNASQEAEIPLNAGWNLITNPFTSTITWSKIQSANGSNAPIYTFSGSFSTSTSFEPYVGYYFFNGSPNTTLATLKVPYASIFSKSSELPEPIPGDWRVNVALSSGEVVDGETWFGVSINARENLDPLDHRKPHGVSTFAFAYFDRPEWDADYSTFATDIRPQITGIQRWDFSTINELSEPSTLVFRGVKDVPYNYVVYLVDPARGKHVDLRSDSVYRFRPFTNPSRFSVLVGSSDLVMKKAGEVIPTNFSLSHNFPNPFNPTTTLSVTVPKASDVRIDIYSTLGHRVRTLFVGLLEAGRHWFSWDGRNDAGEATPSGAYYCRLSAPSGRSFVTKMILIR
jgi:hypothetical protein